MGVVACRRYEATVARGSNVRTRAYSFRRASFVFCERLFFCLSTRSTRQHSRKRYARTIGGKLALLARARSRTRFAHVIVRQLSPRAFIGQEFFGNFVKRCMALSQSRAPFERGSKLDRKTMLTDSRFPGTTELLSAASVELKCVRANLEEQVRI